MTDLAIRSTDAPLTDALLDAIAAPGTTPRLVVDLDIVERHYREFVAALPGVEVFYAIKANPHPEVLRLLAGLGSSFDIASIGELRQCLALDIAPSRLSFGNTIKKSADIAAAYAAGVELFAFDAPEELDKLIAHAPGAIAFCRLTTDSAGSDWPLSRKFGTDCRRAGELLVRAAGAGMRVGLSFHVGSQQSDPYAWARALASVGEVLDTCRSAGVRLDVVNLGGGFPARYLDTIPEIDEIGEVILASLERLGDAAVRVIAEPGRSMVGDAGVLVTSVVSVTEREAGSRWVYVDAGVYGGLAETLGEAIRYRIRTTRDDDPTGTVVIAGPSCDSTDVMYDKTGYQLPLTLAEGDQLYLLSTGAYTTAYASTGFNGFDPPTVEIVGGSR